MNKNCVLHWSKFGLTSKLKENGVPPDELNKEDDDDKYTPLMWASRNGYVDVVQYLCSFKDLQLDKKGGWNESTATMKAAGAGHLEIVKVLVEKGANVNLQNDFRSTALMLAAERGRLDIVKYLAMNGADLNLQNELEYSALILAAEYGFHEVIKALHEKGAHLEIQNKFGKTALVMAAEFGHYESLKVLIEAGAAVNHRSKKEKTALMLSAVNGHRQIVELLLVSNADVNFCNEDGDSPLTMSFVPRDPSITKLLLQRGASINNLDKIKRTPLMLAAEYGNKLVVEILLQRLSDEEKRREHTRTTEDGSTALHLAAMKGHIDTFIFLLDNGYDGRIVNKQGKKALTLLGEYYVQSENSHESDTQNRSRNRFSEFVHHAASRDKLLDMLSNILPRFRSPNSVLNQCFTELLLGLKKSKCEDLVAGLVHLGIGIRESSKGRPLEKLDLNDRVNIVEDMLVKCMNSDALDKEENVVKIFLGSKKQDKLLKLAKARTFLEGPLDLCVKHRLLSILGTRPVIVHVDDVFWGNLRENPSRSIYTLSDLLQMRSNAIYCRTCPAANFFLEGASKLLTLFIVGVLLTNSYGSPDLDQEQTRRLEIFLLVINISSALHEVGELYRGRSTVGVYFKDIWNHLDLTFVVLIFCWAGEVWKNGSHVDVTFPSDLDPSLVTSAYDLPHSDAKVFLAVAAVPLSLSLLQYMCTIEEFGKFVLLIFALCKDLMKIIVVFAISVVGFGIAFHGLFKYAESDDGTRKFASFENTVTVLFDAALGQHDFTMFNNEPYHLTGITLFFIYIIITMVVLLNIVIASFTTTYEKFRDLSLQNWCLMKAKYVHYYSLIVETNPLCMLPPPLNIITIVFSPVHYLIIYLNKPNNGLQRWRKAFEAVFVGNIHIQHVVDNSHSQYPVFVLSLCGTISDHIMSYIVLIPCTLYEIFLCLRDVRAQASTRSIFHICVAVSIFCFPLVFFAFMFVLLFESWNLRSKLRIDETHHEELDYSDFYQDKKVSDDTPPDHGSYTRLNIKIIEAKFEIQLGVQGYVFSRPSLYAELELGKQILRTSKKDLKDIQGMKVMWNSGKDFYISYEDKKNKHITLAIYDSRDQLIANTNVETSRWIANGRFEGDIEVFDKEKRKVGMIGIVAKVLFENIANEPSQRRSESLSIDDVKDRFPSDNDKVPHPLKAVMNEISDKYVEVRMGALASNESQTDPRPYKSSPTILLPPLPESVKRRKLFRKQNRTSPEPGQSSQNSDADTTVIEEPLRVKLDEISSKERGLDNCQAKASDDLVNVIFTTEDRERIFHGIQENDSYLMKNPFAFEIHKELQLQLGELNRKTEGEFQAINRKIEYLLSGL